MQSYIQSLRTESRMSFDLQPILKGELLRLRPLRLEDFHDLYAVASDPLIWEQHPVRDRYKEEVFNGQSNPATWISWQGNVRVWD